MVHKLTPSKSIRLAIGAIFKNKREWVELIMRSVKRLDTI